MEIKENVMLAPYTTLSVGGPADYFCAVENVADISEAIQWAREQDIPLYMLGDGTNVLVPDEGVRGLVVEIVDSTIEWREDGMVIFAAGTNWDALVAESVRRGLWGIENLSGIPGTVGAAPVQNIGAYGTELKDVCEWVEIFDTQTGQFQKLEPAECAFGYRDSIFKHEAGRHYIITRVALKLKKNDTPNLAYKDLADHFSNNTKPTLRDVRDAVLAIRARKFPDLAEVGTAGSFFKNPIIAKQTYDKLKEQYPDIPAYSVDETQTNPAPLKDISVRVKIPLAWILDHVCKLKGYREGNVGLWEQQPLVLVNYGGVTASDIEMFAEKIARTVKDKTGIAIEREVSSLVPRTEQVRNPNF